METHVSLAYSHCGEENPLLIFHQVGCVEIVALVGVVNDDQFLLIRLEYRLELFESSGEVRFPVRNRRLLN